MGAATVHARVPQTAVVHLDVQIDCNFADVMQQRRIGCSGCPGLGLRGLILRCRSGREKVGLSQLERIGDDLKPVVKQAAGIGVVVRFRRWKLLDQLGVPFQRAEVQHCELLTRE